MITNDNGQNPLMEKAPEMADAPQTGTGQKDASALVKKIGKTTYVVQVHFSETSR